MKVLFITHLEDDCFLQPLPELEFTVLIDTRSLDEIFSDTGMSLAGYDILFIHPEEPRDPGWRRAPVPSLIFSGGFRKPLVRENVAHVPREIVEKEWFFILEEFSRQGSFIEVFARLQEREREAL